MDRSDIVETGEDFVDVLRDRRAALARPIADLSFSGMMRFIMR